MKSYANFLAVVEVSRNFNYATSPRLKTFDRIERCPDVRSRTTTLTLIQNNVTRRLSECLPDTSSRLLIWLLDEQGSPSLFITGLLDMRSGKLTRSQFEKLSNELLPMITSEQTMSEMSVTVSATAELTFSDGFDFETTDFDGDGEERDDEIADYLVEESCGFLDQSYVSYVERDGDCLLVNAEVIETVNIEVPWGTVKTLRQDQFAFLSQEAEEVLCQMIEASSRLVNVSIELETEDEFVAMLSTMI